MRRNSVSVAVLVLAASLCAGGQVTSRIGTWNAESLGAPGSLQWTSAVSVAARIDCDVLCLEEVEDAAAGDFPAFASQSGYPHHALSIISGTLSGGLRLGVLSKHPIVSAQSHTSASLSGQGSANDITRVIFQVNVQVPGASTVLGLFVLHLKSGSGATNEFRRAVEITRLQQAIMSFTLANPGAPYIVCGDFNDDVGDGPFGTTFNSLPGGLPTTFNLGNDISFPVVYDPFTMIAAPAGVIAPATQEDSTTLFVTRPVSGRRLDYLVLHGSLTNLGDEVYLSSRDNGIDDLPLGNWLMKTGAPLSATTSLNAADHLPVFGDFSLTSGPPVGPTPHWIPGDVVVSEYMQNPAVVSDATGEWLELFNTTANAIDLQGFHIRDLGSDDFTLPTLIIPARGHVVLSVNANSATNGGVIVDYQWPSGTMTLGNGDDEIQVVAPDGTILDTVIYDNGATFPDPNGASVERRDPTAIPQASNFGVSVTSFGSGDFGTPGSTNSLDIAPIFTTLSLAGPLTPGTVAFLNVAAPASQANKPYLLAASFCPTPGIPTGLSGRTVDLCFDDLLLFSTTPGNGIFNGFSGSLNFFGLAVANVILPPDPALTGFTIYLSGVVLDPFATESIASVMDNAVLTIN